MSKNLDEAVRLQTERRENGTREVKGRRPQGIADGRSTHPAWPAHLSRLFPEEISVQGVVASSLDNNELPVN